MAKYSKFNIVYQLQKWMDSVAGQTFLNYATSSVGELLPVPGNGYGGVRVLHLSIRPSV